jgi:hypothetical protein
LSTEETARLPTNFFQGIQRTPLLSGERLKRRKEKLFAVVLRRSRLRLLWSAEIVFLDPSSLAELHKVVFTTLPTVRINEKNRLAAD